MQKSPHFQNKIEVPVWPDLIRLARELDGFPKYLGQHPGGMILSYKPLIDMLPVQRGAIEGCYVCQWVVAKVKPFRVLDKLPQSKDWG